MIVGPGPPPDEAAEEGADEGAERPPPVVPRRRWRPPVVTEPLVVVIGVVGVGIWLIWDHHPRKGLATVALGFAAAALLRLVLPARDAGLLVVRGRLFDFCVLSVLAGAVAVLAVVQNFGSGP